MLPPFPDFDEDDAPAGPTERRAVGLFVQPELQRDKRDWIVVYHFMLGEVVTMHSFLIGPLSALSIEEALEKARDQDSPLLRRAQELFLQAVPLEVMH